MITVLVKAITNRFYKANAGFFLFFFFIFFGAVQAGSLIAYHFALIQGLLQSPVITIGVLCLWLLYNNKCIGFVKRTIKANDGSFLHVFGTRRPHGQRLLYTLLHISIYLPVLLYSLIVIAVAFNQGRFLYLLLLIAFQMFVCAGSAALYFRWINNKPGFKLPFQLPASTAIKSSWMYLLSYIINKRKLAALVIKMYSLIVLYILLVWNNLSLDSSDAILPFITILLAHVILCFWLVQFMEKELSFFRNLPFSVFKIIAFYLLAYVLLFLPELVFISSHIHSLASMQVCITFYGVSVACLLFYTAILYNVQLDMNEYIKVVFMFSFVSIFFFLTHNYIPLMLIEIAISLLLFKVSYTKFEWIE